MVLMLKERRGGCTEMAESIHMPWMPRIRIQPIGALSSATLSGGAHPDSCGFAWRMVCGVRGRMHARADQEKVAALMESISEIGLQEPVSGDRGGGGGRNWPLPRCMHACAPEHARKAVRPSHHHRQVHRRAARSV